MGLVFRFWKPLDKNDFPNKVTSRLMFKSTLWLTAAKIKIIFIYFSSVFRRQNTPIWSQLTFHKTMDHLRSRLALDVEPDDTTCLTRKTFRVCSHNGNFLGKEGEVQSDLKICGKGASNCYGLEVFYCDEWVGLSEGYVQKRLAGFESSAKEGAVGSLLQL